VKIKETKKERQAVSPKARDSLERKERGVGRSSFISWLGIRGGVPRKGIIALNRDEIGAKTTKERKSGRSLSMLAGRGFAGRKNVAPGAALKPLRQK